MQHSKHSDFNPLDILATAAALKQTNTPETKQKIVIVKPKEGVKIINSKDTPLASKSENVNESNAKNNPIGVISTTSYVEDGVKKVKLTISPELEKMLNEHNYGSIQKVNSGNKTILKLPDVLSLGKDNKVIVKLVDKSGDHVKRDTLLAGVNTSSDKNKPEAIPHYQNKNDHKENKSDTECSHANAEQGENSELLLEDVKEKEFDHFKDISEESNQSLQDIHEESCSSSEKDKLEHVDSVESLAHDEEACSSYTVPICKPVEIDDFDVCNERIDTDIRSPVYEDIDFNDSHKAPPNDQSLLESNTNRGQILNIKHSIDEVSQKQDETLLTSEENSIYTQTDKQNEVLEKDGENQYGDNEKLPGKVETGANNKDRCDMGKQQVLDKVETSPYDENSLNSSCSEKDNPSVSNSHPTKLSFSMIDHEYAGKYCEDSLEKQRDSLSEISLTNDFSQDSGFSDSGLSPDGLESRTFKRDSPSLIPVKSEMLPTFDLSDVNKARDAIVALANSNTVAFVPHDNVSPTSANKTSPKIGKFSIGTFASVCNSSLGLQSPEKSQVALGQRIATSLLSSKICPQSKSKSTSSFGSVEHIEHDHDYSLPYQSRPSNIPFSVQKVNKEISVKGKSKEKKSEGYEKRTKRSASSEEKKEDKLFDMVTSDDGKKGHKNDKLAEILKNGSSDSKLKIQGSYKDDFVYFLNTNFRSRRRASQDIPPQLPPDRILVPLPKPGDIIVPHLTNEDLEAIKLGKPKTLSSGQHFNGSSSSSSTITSHSTLTTSVPKNQNSNGAISDIENGIINTILSMETEPIADSAETGIFNNGNDSLGINFSDQLTPEQMELLYSAVDQVQNCDEKTTSSTNGGSGGTDISAIANTDKGTTSLQTEDSVSEIVKTAPSIEVTTKDISSTSGESTPSISNNLELLNGDIKLFPPTPEDSSTKSDDTDDSAPWIVTVSMYWNDLPAIMLDNTPYLRLVDIHKQILPAKDTGILKKRCQLLGVNVKNCSEMQRYFLVQYGKAFNSKSNLIVSKDNAEYLVGYYVNPVTKLPRSEEHHPKPKVPKVSRPRPRPSSKHESGKPKCTVKTASPPVFVHPAPPAPLGRTRHKKINFLELLKGDSNSNTAENSVTEHGEEKKTEGKVSVVVVEPPSGWKKSEPGLSGKKSVKRSHPVEPTKKKSEESQTIDSAGEDLDLENREDKCLTWLGNKRQKLPVKVNKKMKKPGSLKVKWTIFNKANSKKLLKKKKSREVLTVVHKDILSNNSPLKTIQPGNVFMDLYNNENAPCVRCCTCSKSFAVETFLTHQHDNTDEDKLIPVVNPQTLSLRDTSESQKKMWRNFQLKRKRFNSKISLVQNGLPKIPSKTTDSERGSVLVMPPVNSSVRISSRKRKQKQLYPIENYSYSSTGRQQEEAVSLQSSPDKIIKVHSNASIAAENVVTQSNGPLLTSFTALEHDV